jgi:FAD/FMN-containing dehydrogenase
VGRPDSDILDHHGAWSNFSGRVHAHPARLELPSTEAEIQSLLRETSESVRVVGTGHSCTPLCATDGVLLSLDRVSGVVAVDAATASATIRAGSKIHDLGLPLRRADLATINQGDVDVQSLAGAICTGTHGTGPGLGSMSTAVRRLRIVTASGEVIECAPELEPEIFRAARLSLGAFGVISEIELQLMPAYNLHQREWKEEVTGAETFVSRSRQNRHLEFFWSPVRDVLYMKSLNITSDPPDPMSESKRECIGHSADVFPSIREEKFNELEFAIPEERGIECFNEVREMMRARHPDVFWPVEVRTLAADDIVLSPANGRASVTVSVHQAAELPSNELFADAQAVFANYGGRPHWGKFHTLEARELRDLYPSWGQFLDVRSSLDPEGRFANPYLRLLLGF